MAKRCKTRRVVFVGNAIYPLPVCVIKRVNLRYKGVGGLLLRGELETKVTSLGLKRTEDKKGLFELGGEDYGRVEFLS